MPLSASARMMFNKVLSPMKKMKESYDKSWSKWENSERYKRDKAKFIRKGMM